MVFNCHSTQVSRQDVTSYIGSHFSNFIDNNHLHELDSSKQTEVHFLSLDGCQGTTESKKQPVLSLVCSMPSTVRTTPLISLIYFLEDTEME